MENKCLVDILLTSELRANILILLHEGQKDLDTLVEYIDADRHLLVSHLKTLQEHYLVTQNVNTYALTTMGFAVAAKMVPLFECLEELECIL